MISNNHSRRTFLKKSTFGSLGAAFGINQLPGLMTEPSKNIAAEKLLSIHPRYYRWYPNQGEEWLETNTDYATLSWNIPLPQVALVLVDVWEKHYLKEPEKRAETIITEKYLPLLAACRKSGLTIIHAPSPAVARLHPNWLKAERASATEHNHDSRWPPVSFREKRDHYLSYRRPAEPREEERNKIVFPHRFHPKVQPAGKEPVIATGEELHLYCKKQGILFLLYAGFNTNACLITRDYGMLQMCNDRGYETILLKDCTTGMESKYTQASMSQTEGAILFFEMFGQYSITSDEVISGLAGIK